MTVTLDDVFAVVRYRYEHEDRTHVTAQGLPLSERDLTKDERVALLQRAVCDLHLYGDTLSWETVSYHVLSAIRAGLIAEEAKAHTGTEEKAA